MKLEGIHHVTCITAKAQQNVDFYADTLGLRMVKKTVNQDQPTIYHLFYASEEGDAGSDITFFEFPDAPPGRPGDGMVHRIVFRVGSDEALDFWEERLGSKGTESRREDQSLHFSDPEGLDLEFAVVDVPDQPLVAKHPEIPEEMALQGFDGARAYASDTTGSRALFEGALAFEPRGKRRWEARGSKRGGWYAFDPPPAERGVPAAGTVHHVAWASEIDEHEQWRQRVLEGGGQPTPVIDRFYFKSIYFREPSGVLFEIATLGPGFTADEPLESLGEKLSLPPDYEHLRERLIPQLTPITNPRTTRA